MTLVFSDVGLATLRSFVDDATLVAFDLDGTLAPLVDRPADIVIPEAVRGGLERLCARAPVAVITGRACADARRHLGFEPRYLVGNHGAEGLPDGEAREPGFVRLCARWERQLAGLLAPAAHPGIVTENKGASLSLHYRGAPAPEAARRAIVEAVGRLRPAPRRIPGHSVENVLPPDAPDKGEALLVLMERAACHRALFVGDDETDEIVFRRRDPRILGIRVGRPPGSDACLRLAGQHEIGPLVQAILDVLEDPSGPSGTPTPEGAGSPSSSR